jgi:hypothetical protein
LGFGDIARSMKRNDAQVRTAPKIAQNDMSDALMENPKPKTEKQDISYKDSEISGFVPQQRSFGTSRQNNDPRCGSIIKNIASASSSSSQMGGDTTWENCKFRKTNSGKDYCAEYHSLCAKERCRKARR